MVGEVKNYNFGVRRTGRVALVSDLLILLQIEQRHKNFIVTGEIIQQHEIK